MANSILRSDYESKGLLALGLFCFMQMMMMIQKGYAREFQVNWGSNPQNYNQWAERNRFQIGDSLVFSYPPNDESVLHVSEDAYKNCKLDSPIAKYTDGHTVFSFDHSGPYYFISGTKGKCEKNEKLVVIVLSDRTNRSSTANATNAPSPSPSGPIDVVPPPPAPAPANETKAPSPPPSSSTETMPPSAPPTGESPPDGTVEINPTPPPSQEKSPPNAATSLGLMSVTSTMGALFVASTLVF